jgi:hypothetical protein
MSFPLYYIWILGAVVWGAEATFTYIARRRGREAPWVPDITFDPPRFADARLNKIEAILLVIFIPLGMLLVIVGVALMIAFGISDAVFQSLFFLSLGFLLARGMFLSICLAYAELADESPQTN